MFFRKLKVYGQTALATSRGRKTVLYLCVSGTTFWIAWVAFKSISYEVPDRSDEISVAATSDREPSQPLSVTVIGSKIVIASPMHDCDVLVVNPNISECHVDGYKVDDPRVTKDQDILPEILHVYLDMGSLSEWLYLVKFHLGGDPFDAPSVVCVLRARTFDRTFTGRSIAFRYIKWLHADNKLLSGGKNVYFPVRVGIQDPSMANISVTGGEPVVVDSPFSHVPGEYKAVILSDQQFARFDWDNQNKRDARDLALVVIGMILGITGSALFELLKVLFVLDD